MHEKFIARDGEAVWTGSMNWTNDSMTRMENTIVSLISPELTAFFERDFDQLWTTRQTLESGAFRTSPAELRVRRPTGPDRRRLLAGSGRIHQRMGRAQVSLALGGESSSARC